MRQLSGFHSRVKQVLSSSRRRKLFILAKEGCLSLPLPGRVGAHTVGHLPSYPPTDPASNSFVTHAARAIDTLYFNAANMARIEDRAGDDGLIHANHHYEVQQLFGASTYTNESTHRSIFDRHGALLERFSYSRPGSNTPKKLRIPVTRNISGTTLNLYGNTAAAEGNYLHWFVDALARLFLVEKFHSPSAIDQILVPPLKYDFHWDSLEALGFDRSRVIELQPLDCFRFECLLTSSSPRGKGSSICPDWIMDRYYETLFEKAKDIKSVAGKKIYVSRRDAPNRMFINEEEVCQLLENRGYDIVELSRLNLWEKIAVFRDADVIISQTGAGLANLMYCHSSVKVLELVDERFIYPLYASMAVYRGGLHQAHLFSSDSTVGGANAILAKSYLNIEAFTGSLIEFEALHS